ncbi:MAG: hypothetical protein WA294_05950 [Acidobacteriaceae bacterium]
MPAEFRVDQPPADRILVDVTGRSNGKLVGILVFHRAGLLRLLEIYRLEDLSEDPFGLPALDTVERTEWTEIETPQGTRFWKAKSRKLDGNTSTTAES